MTEEKFQKIIEKIQQIKKDDKFDLSTEEDLSVAIMNLISLEEHLFFTAEKTGKNEYFDLFNEIREIRKELMKKMIKEYEGEAWCVAKHLLAAAMRLIEVGTKLLSENKHDEAKDAFQKAYRIYAAFWAVRLKMADLPKIKDAEKPWTVEDIVNKLVNCCNE
jgi:predicted S18 family serine protease